MVKAMGGKSLVSQATLQITDASGHIMPVDGALFVTITRVDDSSGAVKRTQQMAYVCKSTWDLVLSREAMTDLGMVAKCIDELAMVKQLSAEAEPSSGHLTEELSEESVTGGQLTKDLVRTHNELFPKQKVSLDDLQPSLDPDHVCRGSVAFKNGLLICGCPIRAEAPEPITHRDVANFDNLSIEALRKKINEWYMSSAFNNCRNKNFENYG